jgi:uncharacterized protein
MEDAFKDQLLQIARRAVEAQVEGQELVRVDSEATDAPHAGAFVTLRTRGYLRGCIGTFHPLGTLWQTVQEMAVEACHDLRFVDSPITASDLPDLRIEISVLSPLQRTSDPTSLTIGTHGIYIRRGRRVGCFLPQVAAEMHWDAETFLSECCSGKAGLPRYAWQDRDTEVYLFTAEHFSD